MRLLYEDGYREPSTPTPAQRQTDPPTVPITKLYPGDQYPKGKEVAYTVKLTEGEWVCVFSIFDV